MHFIFEWSLWNHFLREPRDCLLLLRVRVKWDSTVVYSWHYLLRKRLIWWIIIRDMRWALIIWKILKLDWLLLRRYEEIWLVSLLIWLIHLRGLSELWLNIFLWYYMRLLRVKLSLWCHLWTFSNSS